MQSGRYILTFEYDTQKYRLTTYKKNGVNESQNSDVINQTMSDKKKKKNLGMTDVIEIVNEDIVNIDAGLIENEKFDFRLQKNISKITIKNSKGVTVTEYNNAKLAKMEVDAKYLEGSTAQIEYNFLVINEGELAGYINDIIDYIPNDLQFSSDINTDWHIQEDGKLHNTSLSNKLINPGETVSISLILTKELKNDNLGYTINTAEIAKQSNDLGISDIDSEPGNNNDAEDDFSKAEVIISIKTGAVYVITTIAFTIAILSIAGIVIIKLKKRRGHIND